MAQIIGATGITNADPTDYNVTNDVTLGASQTWNAQAGDINVSGNVNGNYQNLTVTGDHDTTISGNITNLGWSDGLLKTGTGTLTLSGQNAFAGTVNIASGTLLATSNSALGSSNWNNTIQSGGALALAGSITLSESSFNLAGNGTGSGSVLNLSGDNTLNASLNLTGDSVFHSQAGTLSLTQTVALGNYDLTLQGPGNWNLTGTVTSKNRGSLSLTADGTTTISGDLNVSDGVLIDNHGTTTITSNLNLGSSSLTIQGDSTATLSGGQVNAGGGIVIADHASATLASTLNLGGSDLTLSSSGDIRLTGTQINVGDILVSGAGETTFGSQINAETFTQTGSGTTIFNGTGDNYFDSVSLEGGTVIADQDGVAFYTDDLNLTDVDLQFSADSQITEWTTVTLEENVTVYLNGTSQAWDELIITGDSVIDFGGGDATLLIGSLVVDPSAVLTITNWSTENLDVFNAYVDPDTSTPQIIFTGGGGAAWDPISGDITPTTPVPETRFYGALLLGLSLLGWRLHRRRRPTAPSPHSPTDQPGLKLQRL